MDCSLPGSSVHGISRQEYWNELPFPPPGDLPNSGMEPRSPALVGRFFTTEPPGKTKNTGMGSLFLLQWIFPTQESNLGFLHCRQIILLTDLRGKLKGSFIKKIFIWPHQVLVVAGGIFDLPCSMEDL